jgi:hypothetical protein
MDTLSPVLPKLSKLKVNGHPITLPEVIIAKDQPEFRPIPAIVTSGKIVMRWHLGFRERLRVLWSGDLWHTILCGDSYSMQPVMMQTEEPGLMEIERGA